MTKDQTDLMLQQEGNYVAHYDGTITPGTVINVRDKSTDDYEKRTFIKFVENGVLCNNIWRPEKEVVWTYFSL